MGNLPSLFMQAASGGVTPTIVMMTADGKVYRIGGMYSVSSGQIEIYNDVKSINSYTMCSHKVSKRLKSVQKIFQMVNKLLQEATN